MPCQLQSSCNNTDEQDAKTEWTDIAKNRFLADELRSEIIVLFWTLVNLSVTGFQRPVSCEQPQDEQTSPEVHNKIIIIGT